MVNLGYTGRDRAAVERHIRELEREGVPAPPRVPMCYAVANHLLIQGGGMVEVCGGTTSGEAEPVLLVTPRGVLVGVGSDHTDRQLERQCVARSKNL